MTPKGKNTLDHKEKKNITVNTQRESRGID